MQFGIRRATIKQEYRDTFEQCGVQVVALALGLGSLTPGGNQFPHTFSRPSFFIKQRPQHGFKKNAIKKDVKKGAVNW